jgi:hypothetical protein
MAASLTSESLAQRKIFFDVKTRLAEKIALAPIKATTQYFLIESSWAGVVEYGAQYALWLKNLRRDEQKDHVSISLDLELREPQGFSEGKLLASDQISMIVRFAAVPDQEVSTALDAMRRQLKIDSQRMLRELSEIGPVIVERSRKMVNQAP